MFREMRRKRQKLTQEECGEILRKGTSGVLAVSGDEEYPYAVPISYVFDGEKIFFHSAKQGSGHQARVETALYAGDEDRVYDGKRGN